MVTMANGTLKVLQKMRDYCELMRYVLHHLLSSNGSDIPLLTQLYANCCKNAGI